MTGKPSSPGQRKPFPWKPILYWILGLGALAFANLVIYALLYGNGLIPWLPSLPTLLASFMPTVEANLSGVALTETPALDNTPTLIPLVETLTAQPSAAETPPFAHIPFWAESSTPGPTPAFGYCQYTLKSDPYDFLYSIYSNWYIHQNIPHLSDFYAGVHCAVLRSNLKCDYRSDQPERVQPGWTLDLPGVTPNICLSHGGTPVE